MSYACFRWQFMYGSCKSMRQLQTYLLFEEVSLCPRSFTWPLCEVKQLSFLFSSQSEAFSGVVRNSAPEHRGRWIWFAKCSQL